jgi:hypothetical protein
MMSDADVSLQAGAKAARVAIDSESAARLGEILRNGLVASGAVMENELPLIEGGGGGSRGGSKSKSKSTTKSKSKGYGSASKKR